MTLDLHGVLTALATPFDDDERIDVPALGRLVERSISAGVDGLVAAGSTGEVGALTVDERLRLVDAVVEQAAGRVPVIAQTGATTTAEAIRLSTAAERAGADVLMLISPYYEPLSTDETIGYIAEVASATSLPIMLYNIPSVTGLNLAPDTVRGIAEQIDSVQYIKDSSADWAQALQLIHHHADVIGTFIGWDVYLFGALAEGAAGVMAGTANVVPEEIVEVARRIAEGDLGGALALWRHVYPVIDALLSVPFIPAVKAGLAMLGEPVGVPRRPTGALPAPALDRLRASLDALRPVAAAGVAGTAR